ncbi:trypsin-like peptidase domain-containing protein [Streptomyces hebeiensis]|uniref:Trypsin-like peptidase domain-containing protein n=1 Tax=Streptomyces hebeiensis TaxID=229486 RepID=A0ABN1UX96_9ACTN
MTVSLPHGPRRGRSRWPLPRVAGPARPARTSRLLAGVVLTASAVLAAGCSGTGAPRSGNTGGAGTFDNTSVADTTSRAAAAPRTTNDLQTDYETVIRNVLPSVVQIETGNSVGSGVVYDGRGHIVTNAHVVGKQRTFVVTIATGEQPLRAELVAGYPAQDLAVIKLTTIPKGLRAATFGTTSKVAVGQIVLAMGSPLGLSGSVTQGIVSAIGRTVSEGEAGGGTGAVIANMVQTSAAINPGNSGGALANLDSEVIGIPTLAATDQQLGNSAAPGIGFAIPVSTVKTIADQIIKYGKVTNSGRAGLGITGRTVLGPDLQPSGVAVVSVTKNGPAARAGIRPGDVIVKLDGTRVPTFASLAEQLASDKPGQKVRVTYVREGSTKVADVTLGKL